jgi:hypothetical protein
MRPLFLCSSVPLFSTLYLLIPRPSNPDAPPLARPLLRRKVCYTIVATPKRSHFMAPFTML